MRHLPLLITATILLGISSASAQPTTFDIYTAAHQPYRLPFEGLVELGLSAQSIPASRLELRHHGELRAWRLGPSATDSFGPGDYLEFLGIQPSSEDGTLSETNRLATFTLEISDDAEQLTAVAQCSTQTTQLRFEERIERDGNRFVPETMEEGSDLWFWGRIDPIRKPFGRPYKIPDAAGEEIDFQIEFRAWSKIRGQGDELDHSLKISIAGEELGLIEFDGRKGDDYVHQMTMPTSMVASSGQMVAEIADREINGMQIVDVVLLDGFTLSGRASGHHLWPIETYFVTEDGRIQITGSANSPLHVVGDGGLFADLLPADAQTTENGKPGYEVEVCGSRRLVVYDKRFEASAPELVAVERLSDWKNYDEQTDYIIFSHRRLIEGAERIAEIHRKRGLSVAIVDIEDVYDEFSHGEVDPLAIRTFLRHAVDSWKAPAPSLVLLLGDSSWDYRGNLASGAADPELVLKRMDRDRNFSGFDSYGDDVETGYSRNLIPTVPVKVAGELAASDNELVRLDDDGLPDLAIGRIPVASLSELEPIIKKIESYLVPQVGPWRQDLLFIAADPPHFRSGNDRAAKQLVESGFIAHRVYTDPMEKSNDYRTAELVEQIDEGRLVVQFYGHGGRFIWRTGPTDFKQKRDLFGLQHVESLSNTNLPLVISLTCYSGPFDHPDANSLGEAFLRHPQGGAIAVIAASWRNSPTADLGTAIIEHAAASGSIGEGLRLAKIEKMNGHFVKSYNLLGDPAIPLQLPAADVLLERQDNLIRAGFPTDLIGGQILATWIDEGGFEVGVEEGILSSASRDFEMIEGAAKIVVYAWNTELSRDAIGVIELAAPAEAPSEEAPTAANARRQRGLNSNNPETSTLQ